MARLNYYGSRPKLGEKLLQHAIVFLICVVFPGAVTWMLPATWITFARDTQAVRCTTRTCAFFVVPYKIQHVDQVAAIELREHAGQTKRERRFGRDTNHYVEVDGEGFLKILGAGDQFAEVNVSPASLEIVAGKANAFLESKEIGSKTIFAIANWKFGGIMGGILSSFTMLYVVGYSLQCLKLSYLALKRFLLRGRDAA